MSVCTCRDKWEQPSLTGASGHACRRWLTTRVGQGRCCKPRSAGRAQATSSEKVPNMRCARAHRQRQRRRHQPVMASALLRAIVRHVLPLALAMSANMPLLLHPATHLAPETNMPIGAPLGNLTSVVFRKQQGAADPFDLAIDTMPQIGGAVTIEPRQGDAAQALVFQFDSATGSPGTATTVDGTATPIAGATDCSVDRRSLSRVGITGTRGTSGHHRRTKAKASSA